MSYYDDVYRKRLNRYGNDYATRVQGQREREFSDYLLKSIYRVTFLVGNVSYDGSFEPNKQDQTQTVASLLTERTLDLSPGTILMIPDKDNINKPWMVWWLDNYKASGYNKYIMLRMTHQLTWTTNKVQYTQYAYFYGPGRARIKDTIKSQINQTVFHENENIHMFITTSTPNIKIDSYLEITDNNIKSAYAISEFDAHSTPGVIYVSANPMYTKDKTPDPVPPQGHESDPDYYWITGGGSNGST